MFNKKSFLFSLAFTTIYFSYRDRIEWQKELKALQQVQKGIRGSE